MLNIIILRENFSCCILISAELSSTHIYIHNNLIISQRNLYFNIHIQKKLII